jgi:hypothetical protein
MVRRSGGDAVLVTAPHVTRATEAGLRLVEDHQHLALARQTLELGEVAGRRLDTARGAEDRLGDDGGERANRLPIDQIEADARAGVLARGKGERERTPVAVGRRDRETCPAEPVRTLPDGSG